MTTATAPAEPGSRFPITSRFRTVHSINDDDVAMVLDNMPPDARVVLDYGCHLGHLGFEIAIRHNVLVIAVDNFVGTVGDAHMAETVEQLTSGKNDFLPNFITNMEEAAAAAGGFRGRVVPMRTAEFDRFLATSSIMFDLAFIDASHRIEEAALYPVIAARVPVGGILAGHDYDVNYNYSPGVVEGVGRIIADFEWVQLAYTWCLRKVR